MVIGQAVRAAQLESDQAIGALVIAQQVQWSSPAAALYRETLAAADRAARGARATIEDAAHRVASADALVGP